MDACDPQTQFQELLRRARDGDFDALGELLEMFRRVLRHRASKDLHRRLRAKITDSDLVQETFCTALQKFDEFDGQNAAQWLAWLQGILGHKLHDAVKHFEWTAKRDVRREEFASEAAQAQRVVHIWPPPSQGLESQPSNEALLERCHRGFKSLPRRSRLAIYFGLQYRTMRQAGEALGLSHAAFRKVRSRAIRELKRVARNCMSLLPPSTPPQRPPNSTRFAGFLA